MFWNPYTDISLQGNWEATALKIWKYCCEFIPVFICSRFTAICWPLVQLPPFPPVVSSLRCAEWLHESVNVINVIHYWQDCSAIGFTTKNASSKAGLLFIYSRGFYDFTISLASTLFISYWLLKKSYSAVFKLNPLSALLRDELCVWNPSSGCRMGEQRELLVLQVLLPHRLLERAPRARNDFRGVKVVVRVPRVSREGISHARDHNYYFSVSSSLPCTGWCISESSTLHSSWGAVELLQNPPATVSLWKSLCCKSKNILLISKAALKLPKPLMPKAIMF